MSKKVPITEKESKTIVKDLFSNNGCLIASENESMFDSVVLKHKLDYENKFPEFVDQYEKITEIMKFNLLFPTTNHLNVSINWTNNNCESYNSVLRLASHKKPHKFVHRLVKMLNDIEKQQEAEIIRAIHHTGKNSAILFDILFK